MMCFSPSHLFFVCLFTEYQILLKIFPTGDQSPGTPNTCLVWLPGDLALIAPRIPYRSTEASMKEGSLEGEVEGELSFSSCPASSWQLDLGPVLITGL